MTVIAKDTRAALKSHVLPLLRENGFDDGTPGKLWRHTGKRIDHVELTCFSTYQATTLECTTASFSVRFASSLDGYGALDDSFHKDHVKMGPKGARPSESQMPIRGVLCHAESKPMTRGKWGWEFDWVWHVATIANAETAAIQVRRQFENYALEWLERDWDFEHLLEALNQRETAPMLVTKAHGSHLRLDAESHGSQVRDAHIAMVNRAMSRGS